MAQNKIISGKYVITPDQISDLMVTALEGGINYWCGKVEINFVPENEHYEFASEVISCNGSLNLYDYESDDIWLLTLDMFLKGVEKTIEHFNFEDFDQLFDNHDADTADCIIQFALFDEIVFG